MRNEACVLDLKPSCFLAWNPLSCSLHPTPDWILRGEMFTRQGEIDIHHAFDSSLQLLKLFYTKQ